jgi:hypothetical protein
MDKYPLISMRIQAPNRQFWKTMIRPNLSRMIR